MQRRLFPFFVCHLCFASFEAAVTVLRKAHFEGHDFLSNVFESANVAQVLFYLHKISSVAGK